MPRSDVSLSPSITAPSTTCSANQDFPVISLCLSCSGTLCNGKCMKGLFNNPWVQRTSAPLSEMIVNKTHSNELLQWFSISADDFVKEISQIINGKCCQYKSYIKCCNPIVSTLRNSATIPTNLPIGIVLDPGVCICVWQHWRHGRSER